MREIKNIDGNTVAIIHKHNEWKRELDFLTPNESFIQVGTWFYNKGKELNAHKHIDNTRTIQYTQEAIVIVSGALQLNLYNEDKSIIEEVILNKDDFAVILSGGHGYNILEDDTRVIEIKNGPFFSVSADKALL